MKDSASCMYDVCIIGAGPTGLACLSALRSPYSLDTLTKDQIVRAHQTLGRQGGRQRQNAAADGRRDGQRICVIDPEPWMASWERNFDALQISFLRSPTTAHPDMFDSNSLLAYAKIRGREEELIESGCYDISSLMSQSQTQSGLWKLPSSRLFLDFCRDLVETLTHDFIKSSVINVDTRRDEEDGFELALSAGEQVTARAVILALGHVGKPILPSQFVNTHRAIQWHEPIPPSMNAGDVRSVLVVGGGLTAAQAAQKWSSHKTRVTLCSRRPLVERHFDVDVEWFDRVHANKCMVCVSATLSSLAPWRYYVILSSRHWLSRLVSCMPAKPCVHVCEITCDISNYLFVH